MKLLHITATHLNLSGGIPVVLRDLANAQNRIEGFESRVLSIKADISEMKSSFFDYLGNKSFEAYLKSYNPDIVIFHSHYYFEYLKLFRYLIKQGIPYYIEPHGSFGKAALQKSKFKKVIANTFILRSLMKNAQGYIFLNEAEKEDALFRTHNDLVIPNGIKREEIAEIEESNAEWYFYYIGRYDINHKGLDFLFDALDILEERKENITINFFGTGNDEQLNYLDTRIQKLHSVNAKNCGPIYGENKKRILEQTGIMVLTSRYEGFPMTVLEAWGFGNPCVVTKGTNVLEEVKNNNLGWGTILDAEKIAETIILAKNEYDKFRSNYISNTKCYVEEMYNWDAIAKKSFVELCAANGIAR